jgi:NAD(P)-dependent dehydrogenase (short-subunit alcohol dehydrogenase family)
VAVVTGGASGIGAEVARHLRESGARVAVWDMAPPAGTTTPGRST